MGAMFVFVVDPLSTQCSVRRHVLFLRWPNGTTGSIATINSVPSSIFVKHARTIA